MNSWENIEPSLQASVSPQRVTKPPLPGPLDLYGPLSSKFGTCKTVRTRTWSAGESLKTFEIVPSSLGIGMAQKSAGIWGLKTQNPGPY
jgi:hypothetical protein